MQQPVGAGAAPAAYFQAPPAPPPPKVQCPLCKTMYEGTRTRCPRCDEALVLAASDRHGFPRVPVEYAGFWARLGAALLDVLVLAPLLAITVWMQMQPSVTTIAAGALIGFVGGQGYLIAMHANGGATVGKRAMGIQVRRADGGAIGWSEAFLRDLPYLLTMGVGTLGTLLALTVISPFELAIRDGMLDRLALLDERTPVWGGLATSLGGWFSIADGLVLLFNRRRRSIHDQLAGTVVVHT